MNWLTRLGHWLWRQGLRRQPPRAVIIDLEQERIGRRLAALLNGDKRA